MFRKLALLIIALTWSSLSFAAATISSGSLTAVVSDAALITVTDVAGHVWTPSVQDAKTVTSFHDVAASSVKYDFTENSVAYTVTLTLSGADMNVVVSANTTSDMASYLKYPNPFVSPDGFYGVLPDSEGILAPVTSSLGYVETTGNWYNTLAMFGFTNLDYGYMVIIQDPCDARMMVPVLSGKYAAYVRWTSEKGKFGYDRRLTYKFYSANSGYVEMAQDYRAYLISIGSFKTLAEKAVINPDVTKVLGAYNVWGTYIDDLLNANQLAAQYGINNRLLQTGYSNWNTPAATLLRNAGWLVGKYYIFQDTYDPISTPGATGKGGYVPGTSTFTGYGFVKTSGYTGPSDRADKSHWSAGYYPNSYSTCRTFTRDAAIDDTSNEMLKYVIALEKAAGYLNTFFIDTDLAGGLIECYDPNHPQTRRQDLQARLDIAAYSAPNYVLGGEQAAWWGLRDYVYSEGSMTIVAPNYVLGGEQAAWRGLRDYVYSEGSMTIVAPNFGYLTDTDWGAYGTVPASDYFLENPPTAS